MMIPIAFLAFAVLVCGLIVLALWVSVKIQKRDAESRNPAPVPARPKIQVSGLHLLRMRDPKFDPEAFLSRAGEAARRMHDCGQRRDYAPARSFLSDGQAECAAIRLELEDLSEHRFSAEDFKLLSSEIRSVESDRLFDAVHVLFHGQRRLNEVWTKTGGFAPAAPMEDFHEVWTFVRRPGRETLAKPGPIEGFCPSCGAPVELADAGRCAACSCWVSSGEYDWVLTKTTDAKYWTPVSQLTRDPGLELLGEADPGANLHFMEDRVLVAFWRWKLAVASRTAAPLAAVATAEFSAREEGVLLHAPPDAGGIAIEDLKFASFRFGDPMDAVSFRVRWSGWEGMMFAAGDPQRRWVTKRSLLTFLRKKGTTTAARSGLCSVRCHGCGAPPSRRDLAACEYCGAPFNDGAHHWTLSELG